MTVQLLKKKPAHIRSNTNLLGIGKTNVQSNNKDAPERCFEGLWESPKGSLYVFSDHCFICVSVHSGQYQGWLNKIAVKDIRQEGNHWTGEQAFRNPHTGTLHTWRTILIEPQTNKIIKYFPSYLPSDILVNGHIEVYRKIKYV